MLHRWRVLQRLRTVDHCERSTQRRQQRRVCDHNQRRRGRSARDQLLRHRQLRLRASRMESGQHQRSLREAPDRASWGGGRQRRRAGPVRRSARAQLGWVPRGEPISARQSVVRRSTSVVQSWYRDPAAPRGSNLSNALELTLRAPTPIPCATPIAGMVAIPPGTFMMGSAAASDCPYFNTAAEQPVHQVTITYCFWMGAHEVTQADDSALMGGHVVRPFGAESAGGLSNLVSRVLVSRRAECAANRIGGRAAGIPATIAHRGRVGVRLPSGDHDGVRHRRRVALRPSELRLLPAHRIAVSLERDDACRELRTERLGPLRHARQRLGALPGLFRQLQRRPRHGPVRDERFVSSAARWSVESQLAVLSLGDSRRRPSRRADLCRRHHRLSRRARADTRSVNAATACTPPRSA